MICCACGTGGTLAGIAAGLPAGKRAIGFSALRGGAFLEDEVRRLQSDYGTVTTNWSIELDYHFGGFGRRDEALDPLMLGTLAAILIALSGTSSGEPKNAAGIALLAVVLAGLFAVRLFLAERHGPDEAQVWWLRRQNPAVGGGPERLVNALVAFVDADSAAARTTMPSVGGHAVHDAAGSGPSGDVTTRHARRRSGGWTGSPRGTCSRSLGSSSIVSGLSPWRSWTGCARPRTPDRDLSGDPEALHRRDAANPWRWRCGAGRDDGRGRVSAGPTATGGYVAS